MSALDRLVPAYDASATRAIVLTRGAINRLARRYPFHAAMLARWKLVPTRDVPTAGVTAVAGDGVLLLLNPEFIGECSPDELEGVIHHECNHVLFGHIFTDPATQPDAEARTIAEEVTVNEWVPEPLPGEPVVLADYPHLPPDEDTGTRYGRLAKRTKSKNAGGGSVGPSTLDDHSIWSIAVESGSGAVLAVRHTLRAALRDLTPEERDALPPDLVGMIGRVCGERPGATAEQIAGNGTATVDWRGVLRQIVASLQKVEATFCRPARRMPDLVGVLPARVRRPTRPRVLCVIDTSGSVTSEMLTDIAAELGAMKGHADLVIVECDAAIHAVYPFSGVLREVSGRGGTDLQPPFEPTFLSEHRPDCLVYFTDGFGPAPATAPRIPVIWCLTKGGVRPAPWGRVLGG